MRIHDARTEAICRQCEGRGIVVTEQQSRAMDHALLEARPFLLAGGECGVMVDAVRHNVRFAQLWIIQLKDNFVLYFDGNIFHQIFDAKGIYSVTKDRSAIAERRRERYAFRDSRIAELDRRDEERERMKIVRECSGVRFRKKCAGHGTERTFMANSYFNGSSAILSMKKRSYVF